MGLCGVSLISCVFLSSDLLPSFRPAISSQIPNVAADVLGTTSDEFGLFPQLIKLGHSLSLLKMVVDAKLETTTLLRQRLKEENVGLKAEIESLLAQQYVLLILLVTVSVCFCCQLGV